VGEGKIVYSVADRGGKRSCSSHLACERERVAVSELSMELEVK